MWRRDDHDLDELFHDRRPESTADDALERLLAALDEEAAASPLRRHPAVLDLPVCHVSGDLQRYRQAPVRVVVVTVHPTIVPAEERAAAEAIDRVLEAWRPGLAVSSVRTNLLTPYHLRQPLDALDAATRRALLDAGLGWWHSAIQALSPDVVLAPVGAEHLAHLRWPGTGVEQRLVGQGSRTLRARRHLTPEGRQTLVVSGCARRGPFALLSDHERRAAGAAIAELVERDRRRTAASATLTG